MTSRLPAVLLALLPGSALTAAERMNDAAERIWSAERAPEIVEEVLADSRYRRALGSLDLEGKGVATWLRWWEDFVSWISGLGGRLGALRFDSPILFWLIFTSLLLVLALLCWHITYSVRLALKPPPAVTGSAPQAAATPRFRQLAREAERLANGGDYRDAIRHLLLALLAKSRQGRGQLFAGWTNRELIRHLDLAPGDRNTLGRFVALADRLWYGQQPASREDYERSVELLKPYLKNAGAA